MMTDDTKGNDNKGINARVEASRIFCEIHWEEEETINKPTAKLVESALIIRICDVYDWE